MATPIEAEARIKNVSLIELRENVGMSQQELAEALNALAARKFGKHPNITKKTVGRWERGEVEWPQPFYRRLLADFLACASDDLGFRRPRRAMPTHPVTDSQELLTWVVTPDTVDARVEQDQRRWRETRTSLGQNRRALAVAAEGLYPDGRIDGLEQCGLIAHPSWIPPEPVPLSAVVLDLDAGSSRALITGSERESAQVRPLASDEQRYRRYSQAVRDLAPPRLFENRLCFRVLSLDWALPVVQFQFGVMGFFDSIDTNEALAHEMTLNHLARDSSGETSLTRASWRRLAFRKLIGDPFDLSRRPLMGAIGR